MSYIWENYDENQQFYVKETNVSPYLECLHTEDYQVVVNIFLRLSHLFFPRRIFDQVENTENQEKDLLDNYKNNDLYKEILNLFLHYHTKLEKLRGFTVFEFLFHCEKEKISQGSYGLFPQKQFQKLSQKEQKIILSHLVQQYLSQQKTQEFNQVLVKLFHNVEIYYEKSNHITHIFIHEAKNEGNLSKYELAIYFFKNIRQEIEVRWQGEHLGLIEIVPSMGIEEFAIG